jgi:hypothetical protein
MCTQIGETMTLRVRCQYCDSYNVAVDNSGRMEPHVILESRYCVGSNRFVADSFISELKEDK